MSCCPDNQCIELQQACGDTVELPIVATETGTWNGTIEFAGALHSFEIAVISGQKVSIPNKLNESYTHTLKLFMADGSLFDNTCFSLITKPTFNI